MVYLRLSLSEFEFRTKNDYRLLGLPRIGDLGATVVFPNGDGMGTEVFRDPSAAPKATEKMKQQ